MKRELSNDLQQWLHSENRKPLVLRGARQVGKTWLVRDLAQQNNLQLLELNFEQQAKFANFFASNEPKEIMTDLGIELNITIKPHQCLLFLDEIQATPEILAKLRWFYELMPELAVIAAGSLLEFALAEHEFSMPVGRMSYCYVEPLSFSEFLMARGADQLHEKIQQADLATPLSSALHEKANTMFREYVMVGGMPEAVANWCRQQTVASVAQIHNDLISTYRNDFAKYAGRIETHYLDSVLAAVPKMLGKKFVYNRVGTGLRHASIKKAVDLLCKACVCQQVHVSAANGIPLGAEANEKFFKLLLLDVGLLLNLAGMQLHQIKQLDDILLINEGAIAEQIAGQALRLLQPYYVQPKNFYWQREQAASSAEIDYLVQFGQYIIPIEVKAGSSGKLRSLHQFMAEKNPPLALRLYNGELLQTEVNTTLATQQSAQYTLYSIPFYMISEIERLVLEWLDK